jgi:hypothetical protein
MIRRQGRVSSSRVLPDPLAFAPLTGSQTATGRQFAQQENRK